MRARLRSVPEAELAAWSRAVIGHLRAGIALWERPGTAALFGGLRSEPDLITDFLPWLRARGWRAVLFRCAGENLVPHRVDDPADLRRGPLGVWEPVAGRCAEMHPSELDIVLVPGLAFSKRDGARLGRGGGFYDRLLARPDTPALRVGVAFEAQLVGHIPCEPHDRRVQALVTEAGFHEFPAPPPDTLSAGCPHSAS